jgi:hypothetical protein
MTITTRYFSEVIKKKGQGRGGGGVEGEVWLTSSCLAQLDTIAPGLPFSKALYIKGNQPRAQKQWEKKG